MTRLLSLCLVLVALPLGAQELFPHDDAHLRELVGGIVDNAVATKGEALDRHEAKVVTDSITERLSHSLRHNPEPRKLPRELSDYLRCSRSTHSAHERREHLRACPGCHAFTAAVLEPTRIRPVEKSFRITEVCLDDGRRYQVRRQRLYRIDVLACGSEIVVRRPSYFLSYDCGWVARSGDHTRRVTSLVKVCD